MIDCKAQFPILRREVNGKPLVYLDSAATAQKPLPVIQILDTMHRGCNGNVHRAVHYLAQETTVLYEEARRKIARLIGARDECEIIFTSGATASLNLAAHSLSEMLLTKGDNVVISEMEHHSNIVPWQMECKKRGAELRVIPFDDKGALLFDEKIIDERTKVVAITQASNVLGTMPLLDPIIAAAKAVGAVSVVDGCQGVVHGGVDVGKMECDLYAFSGHKLYGPTGIGVLYGRQELLDRMEPWQGGGDMIASVSLTKGSTWAELPLKFEAGTQNFIGAIGLGAAVDFLGQFSPSDIIDHETKLLNIFTNKLLSEIKDVTIYGTTEGKSPICSFNIRGCDPMDLAMIADKMGVALRSGQMCAEPIMEHFGIRTICRASMAIYNNSEDCDLGVAALVRASRMLRGY